MNRRALLDTHAWLWWVLPGVDRLNDEASGWFEDRRSELFLSMASLWEIAIKESVDRLGVGIGGMDGLERLVARSRTTIVPINLNHVYGVGRLPQRGDPFDRMIAVQSRIEGLPLITADRVMYELNPLAVIWASRRAAPL